ncbi:DUF2059 domain-containing protein [Variovorax sp. Varisp62]
MHSGFKNEEEIVFPSLSCEQKTNMRRIFMLHRRVLACAIAAVFALSANAQSSSGPVALSEQRAALAMRYLELVGYKETWAESSQRCLNDLPSKARKAFIASPGSFGGLSPQSAYWPEVELIYAKNERTKCDAIGREDFYRDFAEGFARNLSDSDLHAAIAFYSSETGKRIQRATIEASGTVLTEMNKKLTLIGDQADVEFRKEFRALTAKYREDPK